MPLVMFSTGNGPACNSWPDGGNTPFRGKKGVGGRREDDGSVSEMTILRTIGGVRLEGTDNGLAKEVGPASRKLCPTTCCAYPYRPQFCVGLLSSILLTISSRDSDEPR